MLSRRHALVAVAVLALGACTDRLPTAAAPAEDAPLAKRGASASPSYILLLRDRVRLSALETGVQAAGGTLAKTLPRAGLALVTGRDARFAERAAKLSGVEAVVPNVRLLASAPPPTRVSTLRMPALLRPAAAEDTVPPDTVPPDSVPPDTVPPDTVPPDTVPPDTGSVIHHPPIAAPVSDFLVGFQWNMAAIGATSAWATPNHGQGVRVAVIDTKVDPTHPDIAPNLNTALSRSFIGAPWAAIPAGDHGTYVAGLIAAPINGFGIVGVAPEAELVSVAVVDQSTAGFLFPIVEGIVYAADIGADVANISLLFYVLRNGSIDVNQTPGDPSDDVRVGANEIAGLVKVFQHAVTYARQQGTTVIAAAGNNSLDFDHPPAWVVIPAGLPGALAISATGPLGWAVRPEVNFDTPAFYTNFGQSEIDFAAPGGNLDFSLLGDPPPLCVILPELLPPAVCAMFDLVLGPGVGSYFWAAGTSGAAPHAAGVAALIIAKHGGSLKPAQVAAELRATSDDLGKPGRDDFYGHGRVNALRAVQQ